MHLFEEHGVAFLVHFKTMSTLYKAWCTLTLMMCTSHVWRSTLIGISTNRSLCSTIFVWDWYARVSSHSTSKNAEGLKVFIPWKRFAVIRRHAWTDNSCVYKGFLQILQRLLEWCFTSNVPVLFAHGKCNIWQRQGGLSGRYACLAPSVWCKGKDFHSTSYKFGMAHGVHCHKQPAWSYC